MRLVILSIILSLIFFSSCEKDENFKGNACFKIDHDGDVYTNQPIHFTNCSQGGNFYLWDFGDGEISLEKTPTHTYSNIGEYNISLSIQDVEFKDVNDDGIINKLDLISSISSSVEYRIVVLYKE